jgi:hypothetical protein
MKESILKFFKSLKFWILAILELPLLLASIPVMSVYESRQNMIFLDLIKYVPKDLQDEYWEEYNKIKDDYGKNGIADSLVKPTMMIYAILIVCVFLKWAQTQI